MSSTLPDFPAFFHALHGHDPFPWQTMLAERVAGNAWPEAIDLPTAAGKTACIDVAVWALAQQAERAPGERTAPRRLWFVVDRRIVVDEAHARARRIAERLAAAAADGPLRAVADRLRELAGTQRPLATARLRGGVLRDDGWARLPSQPAVITSTVDQLGSRLLFRGYGRGNRSASIFAGLAANDSLVLLDEAHCAVPFLQTLRAIARYRGAEWADQPVVTPFACAVLSATPPADIPSAAIFPGVDRAAALDHPELARRLGAAKPAELVPPLKPGRTADADPLVAEAARRARGFVTRDERRRVAVIVNRVATATAVAARLHEDLGDAASVVLLTGRMRPFERDALVAQWSRVLAAADPQEPERPVVVVATQCLEVGADFSFDALVSEAAALDALRQRFGRLNRLGRDESAPAALLTRTADVGADVADGTNDPIYGGAIAATWALLDGLAETGADEAKRVDFGIAALDARLPAMDERRACLAPTPDAPVLLPAHLDLLCQTAPAPRPEPDVDAFLHGSGRGTPEVRVVWRCDLDEAAPTASWCETVALCPPVSTESLAVPLPRLRRWLAESDAQAADDLADVEGASTAADDADEASQRIRPALVWAGRDRSRVVRRPRDLRAGDVVVVPAAYGMGALGHAAVQDEQALGDARLDLWECAQAAAGRPPALRLHAAVLAPWAQHPAIAALLAEAAEPMGERATIDEALARAAEEAADDTDHPVLPPWLRSLMRAVRGGRLEPHPGGGLLLSGRAERRRLDGEDDRFADDDDLRSAAGRAVSLATHSALVERTVARFAARCVDGSLHEALRLAARWHDVGKLDQRFQLLLHQGDELAAHGGEALAKSGTMPTSPARRRAIRAASGLPDGWRHELCSLQLLDRHAPLPEDPDAAELVRHLVASHHGHARPCAPVIPDPAAPAIGARHAGIELDLAAATRAAMAPPHHLAAGVGERFWHATRRHGWWGLAYLEALLRLGDWYASSLDDDADTAAGDEALPTVARPPHPPSAGDQHQLPLPGLDGANPLGYLAALGALVTLHAAGHRQARLHWRCTAAWEPVLGGLPTADPDELAELLAAGLRGTDVSAAAEARRAAAQDALDAARTTAKKAREAVKKQKLRGVQRDQAHRERVAPLEREVARLHADTLAALHAAVPRPELALGKNIDCSAAEFRALAERTLRSNDGRRRDTLDLLAAFASDACPHESPAKRKQSKIAVTPFAFITGGGHQHFLDTVRQLMERVDADRLAATCFAPWRVADEKLSLRWDPVEDRRYALMDRDPTASDNKATTEWMANLLAYRALALFPTAPFRGHLHATAWSRHDGEPCFTWPLWSVPCGPDSIRSLLQMPMLAAEQPEHPLLRERGIVAAFRSRRIRVGSGANFKVNLTPARCLFADQRRQHRPVAAT